MEKNILQVWIDRAGRITESLNLSLNQCSDNNEFRVYYTDEVFTNLEISFRKPDGWVSDKFSMIHTLEVDEEGTSTGQKYAHMDIPEEITNFILAGRNGIITANLYMYTKNTDGNTKLNTLGNIRINVNYVDDANVHTGFSQMYIDSVNARITDLHNQIINVQEGNTTISRAISDRYGNTIDTTYETKHDAEVKFDTLDDRKLDRVELTDQTNRLTALETNTGITNTRLNTIEKTLIEKDTEIDTNTADIAALEKEKVDSAVFISHIDEYDKRIRALDTRVSEVESSTNFADVVDSFSALMKYNKTLEVNDIVQVMSDESFANEAPYFPTTLYRYEPENPDARNGFVYIGKYSSTSFTKAESRALHDELKAATPNKIKTENNNLYLYRDLKKIDGQEKPVSFKTINGESVFGTGNISTDFTESSLSTTSTKPVQNKVITAALNTKADKSDITTINNTLKNKVDKADLDKKQDKLKEGSGISISADGYISVSSKVIHFETVETLPAVGEFNVIYLVKEGDNYTEYVYITDKTTSTNRWEVLGAADLNLDNYYTRNDIDTFLSEKTSNTTFNDLKSTVSSNTIAISGKANRNDVDAQFSTINESLTGLSASVEKKADASELEKFALKESVPDHSIFQEKLVSGENIKTVGGISVLGYGNIPFKKISGFDIIGEGSIDLENVELVDHSIYLEKEDFNNKFNSKVDIPEDSTVQTELNKKADIDKLNTYGIDYNSLSNLPALSTTYATIETVDSINSGLQEVVNSLPDMAKYYEKTETYTKEEVDNNISNEIGKIDLTEQIKDYATIAYVDEQIAAVDVSEQLVDYAKTEDIQKTYSTIDYVDGRFSNLSIPTYSKLSQFENDTGYITGIPDEYITETELDEKMYITNDALVPYIKKSTADETYASVSRMTTSENRLTALENKDTSIAGDIAIIQAGVDNNTLSITALQEEDVSIKKEINTVKTSIPTKVSDVINDKNFTTYDEVLNLIAGVEGEIPEIDTTQFASKTELQAAISDINTQNDSTYAKKTELPDLTPYATKSYVDTEIAELVGTAPEAFDTLKEISDYISKDKSGAEQMTADIKKNKTDISSLNTSVSTLTSKVNSQGTEITALKAKDTTLQQSISAVESKNTAQDTKITNLENADKTLDSKISAINTTITEMKTKDTSLDTKISEIAVSQTGLSNRVLNVENSTSRLETNISTNTDNISAMDSRITTNTTEIASLKLVDAQHQEKIADLEASDETINTKISDLTTSTTNKFTNIDGQINSLSSSFQEVIDGINTSISNLTSGVSTNTTNISTLTEKSNDHESRLVELETNGSDTVISRIETLEETVEENTTNISSLSEHANRNTDAIEQVNSDLETFINTVPEVYITKEDANELAVQSSQLSEKSKGLVDYNDETKNIRLTTDSEMTDFVISDLDTADLAALLRVMVPNTYNT